MCIIILFIKIILQWYDDKVLLISDAAIMFDDQGVTTLQLKNINDLSYVQ
jgi:hypothetical protein